MATKIEGLEAIVERLGNISDTRPVEAAMQKCCALVERSAKQKAPKDTGALRNSISSRVEKNEGEIVGVVFTPLEYAPYVEFGTGLFAEEGGRKTPWIYEDEKTKEKVFTRGQHPQPYLRPALAENREKITKLLKEGVNND